MQNRVAIKHLSGSRANQVDRLALPYEREILFGRDPGCHVRYDERDELVSRRHLKIVATNEEPVRYMVVDLGSRNGTFVNRQKVSGAMVLWPHGRVELGAGGPEFEFQLGTEEAEFEQPKLARRGRHARNHRLARGALVAVLLAVASGAGYVAWPHMMPLWADWHGAQIAREEKRRSAKLAAVASVADVETEWSVFDKQTGVRLTRAYLPNERIAERARVSLVEGAPATLPAFVLQEDRRIEPLLVPEASARAGEPIGGKWASKGIIVSESGVVLTAAPQQRPWKILYRWTAGEPAGVLLVLESLKITQVVPLAAAQFPRWVPAESGFFAEQLPTHMQGDVRGRKISESDLRVDVSAKIAAPGRALRAKLAPESSGIWVAAVEGDVPLAGIRISALGDASTQLKDGQPVWVVGKTVEASAIVNASADGLLKLQAAHCGHDGGVVFDHEWRVLALCVPGAGSKTEPGLAVAASTAGRIRGAPETNW